MNPHPGKGTGSFRVLGSAAVRTPSALLQATSFTGFQLLYW